MRLTRQSQPEPPPPAADDGALSPARRTVARVLLVSTLSMGLSRGPSLLPRTPQDQALVTAGAGAFGPVAALVSEALVTLLARLLGRRRLVAATAIGAVGGAAAVADRKGLTKSSPAAAAASAAQVLAV